MVSVFVAGGFLIAAEEAVIGRIEVEDDNESLYTLVGFVYAGL